MIAKPYSTVVVRIPVQLRDMLDELAAARGEPLSLLVRDALREAVAARRADSLGVAPVSAGRFR
jgi:predicted transcriptional regulator